MSEQGRDLVYESGQWQIHLGRRELLADGIPVPIGGRAFEIIAVLVESANELVTKNDLIDRIWPGASIEENTLQVHISAIRKALGPDRNLLRTSSGRGYRLLGTWTRRQQTATTAPVALPRAGETGSPPANNFPLNVGRLIGRATAAQLVRDLVSAYRTVTLTGPGGIGKTALAIEAARDLITGFGDGGWFVELAALSNPDLVPSAVAGALGLKLSGEISAESIAHAVGAKHLLVVLDNCEHVIDAAASFVERFIRLCPRASILITSREILRIDGEAVYRVPPLDVPPVEQAGGAGMLDHAATALFLARAAALGTDIGSNPAYPAMIAAICRQLDGIPLAIEFAASRAATLGIEAVFRGLRDRFVLLTSGRRTALPRHQTLRATLDWSYQLLSKAERDLLCRLAIFAGSFSLQAACTVVAEDKSEAEVAAGVIDLTGKSLLVKSADPAIAEFRLLETTRVYAIERLTEGGAFGEVARRHAAYFLNGLGHLDDERRSTPPNEHRAASRRHADEVHVALEWAFSRTGDPAMGMALTLAAEPLWFGLFQLAVARGRVEQALSHADAGATMEMRLRIALGRLLWYSDPESDAIEPAFARALEIAQQTNATDVQIQALWGLWAAHRGRGNYPAALDMAHRYAEAGANAGNIGAIHLGDRLLGLTHHLMGHHAVAREFAERALDQASHFDPTSGTVDTPAVMGSLLARILWLTGFPDQAKVAANQAVAAAVKSAHSFTVCYAISLGALPVALWTGDMGEARRLFDLLVAHAGGIPRMELRVIAFARVLKLRDGDNDEVLIASFIESYGDPALIPPFADLDRNATIRMPQPREEPNDATWDTPEALRVDAELILWHDAPGAVAQAETKLLRALEIARMQAAPSWELRCATSLARLWQRQGRETEARDLLATTYGKFTEGFDTADLQAARTMLDGLPT